MRILIVQESDWLKKGPHPQHHFAERLSLRGHKVRVIDYEINWRNEQKNRLYSKRASFSNIAKIYEGAKVDVIRPSILKIKVPGLDYISLIFTHHHEINRQIREFAPDIIISLGILNSYLAMQAARKHKIPFICYWMDVWHTLIPFRYFRFLGKLIEKMTVKKADIILATNKKLRARLIKMGAPEERSFVLSHAVDFNRFNLDVDGDFIRKRYGVKKNDIVITFVGRLSRITGVREIAWQLSQVNTPNLKFMVVGTGSRENELKVFRDKYSLQKNLIITGHRPYDEVPYLIQASNICLLPYIRCNITNDIVPLKILDYKAMCKPIISTRLPGMVEEFGEDNGIIFVDRPEDIIGKVMELATTGQLHKLNEKAKERHGCRSWDCATDELEQFMNEALARRGKTYSPTQLLTQNA